MQNISSEGLTTREVTSQRDEVVSATQEWLGRAANLMNMVRQNFPNKHLLLREYGNRVDGIRSRGLVSPRIVLPAQPLASYSSNWPKFTRRAAATVELLYENEYSSTDISAIRHLDQTFPVPGAVRIGSVQPVALPADSNRPKNLKYEYTDNVTISGQRLDLFSWAVANVGVVLPFGEHANFGRDELRDFATFRDYPPEALVRRPDSIDFHRAKLETFQASLGEVALAVDNDTLNPR